MFPLFCVLSLTLPTDLHQCAVNAPPRPTDAVGQVIQNPLPIFALQRAECLLAVGFPRETMSFRLRLYCGRLKITSTQHGIVQPDVFALVLVDAGVGQTRILIALELVDRIIH